MNHGLNGTETIGRTAREVERTRAPPERTGIRMLSDEGIQEY